MTLAGKFKLYGFAINKEACDYVHNIIRDMPQDKGNEITEYLLQNIQRHNLPRPFIDVSIIAQLLKECPHLSNNRFVNSRLSVFDAFDMPRLVLDDSSNKYKLTRAHKRILSSPDDKVGFFRSRYNLIYRCILRNPLFQSLSDFKLINIETIISKEETSHVLVFGMLYQHWENQWYLEDLSAKIRINIKMTKFQEGFFYDGSFVLVEGFCKEKVLYASQIGYPPAENRLKSRQVLAVNGCDEAELLGSALTDPRGEGSAVFISDIHLDDQRTFSKLDKLFTGFSSYPPVLFVMCGNYMGKSYSDLDRLRKLFDDFGALLVKHRRILNDSTFLFVPGPTDPIFGDVLPRPPIPDSITEGIRAVSPSTILFRSSPCRIRLFSYTIVVSRTDIVHKMSRACISPHISACLGSNVATTVLSQYHVTPITPYISPVYWAYDNSLHIYPHPDVLVLADGGCKGFSLDTSDQSKGDGTIIVNPGSFCNTEFSFKVFHCGTRCVDDSQII